ncbi:MAG: hypothetical protein ACK4OF_03845 [Aquificaceae bacterium]
MRLASIERVPFNYRLFYLTSHSRYPILDVFYIHFTFLARAGLVSLWICSFWCYGRKVWLSIYWL